MHLMAYTVAGAREIDAVLFCNGLYVSVVVGVFKARLQSVMVDIRDAALGLYAVDADRLKLQIRHRSGGVLR